MLSSSPEAMHSRRGVMSALTVVTILPAKLLYSVRGISWGSISTTAAWFTLLQSPYFAVDCWYVGILFID
jgi:hypothetical protein